MKSFFRLKGFGKPMKNEKPVDEQESMKIFGIILNPIASLEHAISQLSIDAYCAVNGTGYGRMDMRMDKVTGKMYVLEVNAQCGLSEDENYTSIGAMVRLGKERFSDMLGAILENALQNKTESIKRLKAYQKRDNITSHSIYYLLTKTRCMKICVLQPDYSHSGVDYKYYDPSATFRH